MSFVYKVFFNYVTRKKSFDICDSVNFSLIRQKAIVLGPFLAEIDFLLKKIHHIFIYYGVLSVFCLVVWMVMFTRVDSYWKESYDFGKGRSQNLISLYDCMISLMNLKDEEKSRKT